MLKLNDPGSVICPLCPSGKVLPRTEAALGSHLRMHVRAKQITNEDKTTITIKLLNVRDRRAELNAKSR